MSWRAGGCQSVVAGRLAGAGLRQDVDRHHRFMRHHVMELLGIDDRGAFRVAGTSARKLSWR